MPILSERHLRRALADYLRHYNEHRPHHGLDLLPPRQLTEQSAEHECAAYSALFGEVDELGWRTHPHRLTEHGSVNEYERAA
jgi:hypothetical protein